MCLAFIFSLICFPVSHFFTNFETRNIIFNLKVDTITNKTQFDYELFTF